MSRQGAQPRAANGQPAARVAQVERIVGAITSVWANPPDVIVLESMANAPGRVAAEYERQNSQGASGKVEGFVYGGKVYLVADALATEADVVRVLFHEALGHRGLRGVFGDALGPILDRIARLRPVEMKAKAKEYGLDLTNPADRRLVAEEVLAEMAQTRPEIGWVKQAVAAIRAWLRKNVPYFKNLRVTDAEIIREYILPARAFIERGQQSAANPNLSPAFSISPIKSVFANIRRGKIAMNKALLEKADVNRAMFRNDLGWIDFVWGDDKKGLAHIFKQRRAKDGMTDQEIQRLLVDGLTRVIAKGETVNRADDGGSSNLRVQDGNSMAILVKNPGSNGWMLTGFEMGPPDGQRAGFDASQPTQNTPTPTQREVGADGGPIVPDDGAPRPVISERPDDSAGIDQQQHRAWVRETAKALRDYADALTGEANPAYKAPVTDSGSVLGPSSYFHLGRTEVRVSTHSKGAFNHGGYLHVTDKASADKLLDFIEKGAATFKEQKAEGRNVYFSRAKPAASANQGPLAGALDSLKTARLPAGYLVGDLITSSGSKGRLSWWHKTVGTQYNLAQRSPAFKRVFDAVQSFINDTSDYATQAANLAPSILPRLENWHDITKQPLAAKDVKALAAPVFEGTLSWARDEAGKPVKLADLEARAAQMTTEQKARVLLRKGLVTEAQLKRWQASPLDIYDGAVRNRYEREFLQAGVVWSDAELKSMFGLDERQIGLYREFRAATDKSLTDLATADMLRFGGKDVQAVREAVRRTSSMT